MITIKRSKSADSRSTDEIVTKDVLLGSSLQHIGDVKKALSFMATRLKNIATTHDHTKIEAIDWFHRNFEETQKEGLDFKRPGSWFWHHVESERHHLNDVCPDDVNLFDVLERVADISMAGMARTGEVYDDTLSPEILEKAYKNTVALMIKNIEVKG